MTAVPPIHSPLFQQHTVIETVASQAYTKNADAKHTVVFQCAMALVDIKTDFHLLQKLRTATRTITYFWLFLGMLFQQGRAYAHATFFSWRLYNAA